MNAIKAIKLAEKTIKEQEKSIAICKDLDTKTLYKIMAIKAIRDHNGDLIIGETGYIAKIKDFNKCSIALSVMAQEQKPNHSAFRNRGLSSEFIFGTIDYKQVLSYAPFNPEEAPLLVHYNYMSPSFKKMCFNT